MRREHVRGQCCWKSLPGSSAMGTPPAHLPPAPHTPAGGRWQQARRSLEAPASCARREEEAGKHPFRAAPCFGQGLAFRACCPLCDPGGCKGVPGLPSQGATTGWLRTTDMDFLTVVGARSPSSRCPRSRAPSAASRSRAPQPLPSVCGCANPRGPPAPSPRRGRLSRHPCPNRPLLAKTRALGPAPEPTLRDLTLAQRICKDLISK